MGNKYIWTTKVSAKGQIVIPKEARDVFKINDENKLVPEYLMLWLTREEFGRFVYWQNTQNCGKIFV